MKTLLQKVNNNTTSIYHFILIVLVSFLPSLVSAQSVKEEWERSYGGTDQSNETSVVLKLDNANNAYVSGVSRGPADNRQIVTVKYSPSGEELWVNHFSYGGYLIQSVKSIDLDEEGNVYLVGSVFDQHGLDNELLIGKINSSDGSLEWRQTNSTGRSSIALSIKVDNKNGVYLAGSSTLFSIPSQISFLTKYSAEDGKFIWNNNFTGVDGALNRIHQIASFDLDENGDVYVTGTQNYSGISSDVATVKYNGLTGDIIWAKKYDSGFNDLALQLAYNTSGNIYVTGQATEATNTEATSFIIKYDAADGKQIYHEQLSYNGNLITGVKNLYTNEQGVILSGSINGTEHVVKLSAVNGELAWVAPFNGSIASITIDETNGIYVGGKGGDADYLVVKYDALAGNQLWLEQDTENGAIENSLKTLIAGSKGNVYLAGITSYTVGDSTKIFLARHLTENGDQIWKTRFNGLLPTNDRPVAIETDEDGNVYVLGMTNRYNGILTVAGAENEIITLKYSPGGELLWVRHYGLGSTQNVSVYGLAIDKAGGVYVIGTRFNEGTSSDFVTLKYAAADGQLLWENIYDRNNTTEREPVLTVDNAGGVYISGYSGGNATVTIKYDAITGKQVWLALHPTSTMFPGTPEISPEGIVVHDGQVYIAGNTFVIPGAGGVKDQDFGIVKYNAADGELVYYSYYDAGGGEVVTAMEFHPEHGIFLLAQQNEVPLLAKFEPLNGNFIWSTEIAYLDLAGEMDMTIDSAGGIYIKGGGEDGTISTSKYDQNATLIWNSRSEGTESAAGLAIETDNIGGVYVLGTHGLLLQERRLTTLKYNAHNGSQLWAVTNEEGNSEFPFDLALDKDLNIFVTGGGHIGAGYSPGADILTIKYSQDSIQPSCDMPVTVTLSLPPHAMAVGEQVRTTADFDHYILGDDHGIRWEWGDGSESSVSYKDPEATHITGQHRYAEAGIYKIGLDFSQSCLQEANLDYDEWMVIYDPSGGNVTGNGSFVSPLTNLQFMDFEGPIDFAFNLGYTPGKNNIPEGYFQFELGNQGTFRNASLEWLVISGNQVVWKGVGMLEEKGNYGFIVSVSDAGGPGPDDLGDKIRIRIWDRDAGNMLVYDNFHAAGDIYDMTTDLPAITTGYIIINGTSTIARATTQQAELYNYPNTFTDKTTINFTLPTSGEFTLEVYDMRGKLVQQLATGKAKAGQNYSYELNGKTLRKGLYIARLVSSSGTQSIKMLLQR